MPRTHSPIWCSVTLSHTLQRSTDPHIPLPCAQLCDVVGKPGGVFKPLWSGTLQKTRSEAWLEVGSPTSEYGFHQNLFFNLHLMLVPNLMFCFVLFTGKKPTFSDKVGCFSGLFCGFSFCLLWFFLSFPYSLESAWPSHVLSNVLQPVAPVGR